MTILGPTCSRGIAFIPPAARVHAFKNNTDQTIRVFINIAPSGFERFFAEAAEWWANPERDMSRMAAIEEKYRTFSVKQ
jgi:hypothetical protein